MTNLIWKLTEKIYDNLDKTKKENLTKCFNAVVLKEEKKTK